MKHQDVTPDGSVAPVMLDAAPATGFEVEDLSIGQAEQEAFRVSGMAKLMALGLTKEEALAIAG